MILGPVSYTHLSVAFWHPEAPVRGFNVRSRLSAMNPLLDGGRAVSYTHLDVYKRQI